MGNKLQKSLYTISSFAPIGVIVSINSYLQYGISDVILLIAGISITMIVFFLISFYYARKNLPPINMKICKISANDSGLMRCILVYMVPFVKIVPDNINILGFQGGGNAYVAYALILALVMFFIVKERSNDIILNPILFLMGYHFYKCDGQNGISGYTILSKQKLRSHEDITCVKRIFETFLLDWEK